MTRSGLPVERMDALGVAGMLSMSDFWQSVLNAASVPTLTVIVLILLASIGERKIGP